MPDPTVYVETTIPNFYYEERTDPAAAARRDWTRQWWEHRRSAFDLVTSVAVLDELEAGYFPTQKQCRALMSDLPLVPVETAVLETVQVYIERMVMPRDPAGDALHLALASHHRCDFLLTWNCKHLANANKFGHIRRVNALMGLYVPSIVTPLELLEEENGAL